MANLPKPLSVTLYQDVLCAWCYLAEARLHPLREEFRDLLRWKVRPFPLRLQDARLTDKERDAWARELGKARLEPDGARLRAEIWTLGDPPHSSVPALAALEAARLQGPGLRSGLARAMQRAALEQSVNISRTDVVFELAGRCGLNMNRFAAAFNSPETRRLILEEHRLASSRGVRGVPTLVIERKWMISGLRSVEEYREHILQCLNKSQGSSPGDSERILH